MSKFSLDQFKELKEGQHEIKTILEEKKIPYPEKFIDNSELLQLMKISKRTAQSWRDKGLIACVKIGGKIYYHHADVMAMMEKHYQPALKRNSK